MNRLIHSTLRPGRTLAVLLCTAGLLSGCHPTTPESEPALLSVRTVHPQPTAGDALPRFAATLAWDRESALAFRVAGVVDRLDVRLGQVLERGQLVASLVATPYEAAATRAHADLDRVQRAQKRNEALLPAGAIASSVQEDTDSNAQASQAAVRAADYDLASAWLVAPFRATVLARQAEVGDTLGAGQAVVRVADLDSPLIARVAVPQRYARGLHRGDAAQVRIDATGEALAARVGRIGTLADARTDTLTVDLFLDKVPSATSGAVGSATLGTAAKAGPAAGLALPAEALLDVHDGRGHVYLLDTHDGTVHRTEVQVIGMDGEFLQVRGLKPEDKIVTTGAGFARDGQHVRETTP